MRSTPRSRHDRPWGSVMTSRSRGWRVWRWRSRQWWPWRVGHCLDVSGRRRWSRRRSRWPEPGQAPNGSGGARSGGRVDLTRPRGSVISRVASGRSLACQPGRWSRWWCRLQSSTRLASWVGPPWSQKRTWWPSHQWVGRSQPGKRQCRSRITRALNRGGGDGAGGGAVVEDGGPPGGEHPVQGGVAQQPLDAGPVQAGGGGGGGARGGGGEGAGEGGGQGGGGGGA